MPAAARTSDLTAHGPALNPGPGSPTVSISFMPAWRALPADVGAGLEQASNAMKSLLDSPALTPPSAAPLLAQVQGGCTQAASAAAAEGNPSAASAVSSAFSTLATTNATLTSTYASASAAPGGQPAATQAYTEGIKAAAAAAASAAFAAIAAMVDMHNCPTPCPPMPHGPGVVTKGSSTVTIDGLPAARQGDNVIEACGGSNSISKGDQTVEIG